MCESCGCAFTDAALSAEPVRHGMVLRAGQHGHAHGNPAAHSEQLNVMRDVLANNDRLADHNRQHFAEHGVFAVNLMSSPGAGKTTLLEATIEALRDEFRIAVVEGDLATENDARRIRAHGVPAVQITTGNACHLDAGMVHNALHDVALADVDLLFIENVGNLVCPASFDLGAHCSVALLSVPEGDDKPEKYPVMFRSVDLVLLTKTDLLEHIPEFSVERARGSLRTIACAAPIIECSSRRPESIAEWCNWLRKEVSANARWAPLRERASRVRHEVAALEKKVQSAR